MSLQTESSCLRVCHSLDPVPFWCPPSAKRARLGQQPGAELSPPPGGDVRRQSCAASVPLSGLATTSGVSPRKRARAPGWMAAATRHPSAVCQGCSGCVGLASIWAPKEAWSWAWVCPGSRPWILSIAGRVGSWTLRLLGYDLRRAVSTDNRFKVQHGPCPRRRVHGRSGEGVGQEALGYTEGVLLKLGREGMVGREDETAFGGGPHRSEEQGGGRAVTCQERQETHGASSDQDNPRCGAANRLTQQHTGPGSPQRNISQC